MVEVDRLAVEMLDQGTVEALDDLLGVFEGACGVCDCPPAWAIGPDNVALWDMDQWDLRWAIKYGQIEEMLPWATRIENDKPTHWRHWDGKLGLNPDAFPELSPRERCLEVFRALGEAVWDMLPHSVQREFYDPEMKRILGAKPGSEVTAAFAEAWARYSTDSMKLKQENPRLYRVMRQTAAVLCTRGDRWKYAKTPAGAIARGQECDITPGRLLYHTTTDLKGVKEKGLLTRVELGLQRGTGLGGGQEDTISFTTDKAIAEELEFVFREAAAYLRGEVTPDDLVRMAKRGEGAKQPYYERMREMVVSRVSAGGRDPEEVFWEYMDRLRRGVRVRVALLGKDVSELLPDSRPVGPTWVGGDGKTYTTAWEEPADQDYVQSEKWEVYQRFLYARQEAGGPDNPVFFLADLARLAQRKPEDIRALTFTLRPGVELTDENAEGFGYGDRWLTGMSELRLKSGKMVMPYPKWRKEHAKVVAGEG